MEQEDKWKLLKMCIRCNKVKKHKPRRVLETQLKFDGIESPLFADSEIKEKSFTRLDTHPVRTVLKTIVSET